MDFYEVLAEVVQLLQREGRASYRALKRQFNLDDAYIDDLKEELLFSHPVVDEDGRGLVWTGETEAIPVTTSQPNQSEPRPVVEQAKLAQAPLSPAEPHISDAERRQLTVMFCDLVGSTNLSGILDPEDYREVVREYQQVCSEVIHRFDGYIAQYLGDGLLVYFSYPQAHEDDAQRAVRSGLGIIEAIRSLNTGLEQEKGITLAVRLGIHIGLVVVGEMGGSGRQEQLALGETPNLAARIQGVAEPDTVVMSADTYRLIQGYFDCESLGEHVLRGVSQPIVVYRVLGDTGIQSRLDVASTRGLTPLIGRESESTLLFERWEQAKDGNGQVVLLSGETGIGKSRLIQVLKDHVAEGTHTRLECRSLPYFTNSALYPITDFLQRTLRFQTDDTPEKKLEKLAENLSQYRLPLAETVPLFGALLSLPVPEDRYPLLNLSPQRQRQKTLEAIVAIILELCERQPVLFILEDLHWGDPTTLELLNLLIDQTPTASLCVLLTCRPEFQPTWSHRSYLTGVTVNRLSSNQIARMAEQVVGDKRLPAEVIEQLVDKTDGVPLYVEEMTKAVLESGILKETNGHYELAGSITSLSIPSTLQDSLMARLDRLMTAKVVAQLGATIGRQFDYELLHAVAQIDEPTLQRELGRLVEAELVYQRGLPPNATYTFKHALVQDTAYGSLLRSTRQGYHRRIAGALTERFPETAKTQPELLAHHYTEAGRNEQAVDFWYKAGQRASERSAYMEAIGHLRQGLAVLALLPESPERVQHDLMLHLALGPALMATKGQQTEEVERVFKRAHELCQQVGETSQRFAALGGLHRFYFARGELHPARDLGEQFLRLALGQDDPALLLTGHWLLGTPLCWLGEFVMAHEHFERNLALYDPKQHHDLAFHYALDPGSSSRAYTACTLWTLGYPDQALRRGQEARVLAQEQAHPFSLTYVQLIVAGASWLDRAWQSLSDHTEALLALATEHGFPIWILAGTFLRGCALAALGQWDAGLAQMLQGQLAWWPTILGGFYLVMLADAYGKMGRFESGLMVLNEAQDAMATSGCRSMKAELHRLKGQLLLQQSSDNATEAETCFHQAISIAQNQSAKSWELRASTSLAKLWQQQGKRQEARELLEPVYAWFTEGFDTADLINAKTLLDELT